MRILLLIIIITILSDSCSERGKLAEDITGIDSTGNTLFVDKGQSSIVINNSGDSTKCYDVKSVQYEIVQLAPEGEWINYISKEVSSTITCDGQEGQKRTITVQLSPVDRPKHTSYFFKHDADEIILGHDYYETIFYGCCDAEPIHKVYDYESNLIVEGHAKILTGAIPNNSLKFFVSYKPTIGDTSVIGSIFLAYDADNKYQIDILSSPLPPELCSQYSPEFTLTSTNRYDTLDVFEDEYQLWELEQIESIDQIGNIIIRVQYLCEVYFPVEPLQIPITRGKPFGNSDSRQTVVLKHKGTLAEPAHDHDHEH